MSRPLQRWGDALRQELGDLPLRVRLASWLGRAVPTGMGGRLRAALYRLCGFSLGQGTLIVGPLAFGSAAHCRENLRIGSLCFLNTDIFIDANAPVTIGDRVSIGHHVIIITADHAIGASEFRAGALTARPVTIEEGAWIAARATLLPGVTIGRGAVVAAGAVVTKDVAPNTLVGGIPAKLIRHLDENK